MIKMPRHLQVPSGRVLDTDDIQLLVEMHRHNSIEWLPRPIDIASGIKTRIYVRARSDVTDTPLLLNMVGRKIVHSVMSNVAPNDHQPNLIGLPVAGTPLAVAASMASVAMQALYPGFYVSCRTMREKLKGSHGASNRWVEGRPELDKFTYWVVENATTSGKTIMEKAVCLEEDGYPSREMPHLVFVERQQGAIPRLHAAGFKRIIVCYNLLDILYMYSEFKLWSPLVVKMAMEEIRAHQFA